MAPPSVSGKTPQKLASKSTSGPTTPKPPKLNKPDVEEDVENTKNKAEDVSKDPPKKDPSQSSDLVEADPTPLEGDKDVKEPEATSSGAEKKVEESKPDEDDITEKPDETNTSELEDDTSKEKENVQETGQKVLGGAKNTASKATDGDVSGVADDIKDTAEDAKDTVEDTASDAKDQVEDTASDAKDQVEDTASDAKDQVEDTADVDLPDVPNLSILKGLQVDEQGIIHDKDNNPIGRLVEGDAEDLAGWEIGDDGEILDDDGDLVGRTELLPEKAKELAQQAQAQGEEAGDNLPGVDILQGLTTDATGNILNDEADTIGQLVEGDPKELMGKTLNEKGEFLDDDENVIGRAQVHPDAADLINQGNEPEETGDAIDDATEDVKDPIGEDEENPEDKPGEEAGEESKEEGAEGTEAADETKEEAKDELPPLSTLEGLKINKGGKILNDKGVVVGELTEGDAKKIYKLGLKVDSEGQFWDGGKVIGKAKTVQLEDSEEDAPFHGLEGLIVTKDGMVKDENDNIVGKVVEGDAKKLLGRAVDEDGDILDKKGSVVGRAERYEEPEAEEPEPEAPADLSALAGCTVNKAGHVVNSQGDIVGRVTEGDPKAMIGRKVDGQGQIWSDSGKVIGKAELVEGADNKPDGPFADFENNSIAKDGTIKSADGSIIGRVIEGDIKKLVGKKVDADGDISDSRGNTIGKAERWEPEEKERRINPMSGRRVNKEGEVRDENGDVLGRLTAGDLGRCVGLQVDDNGYVIDNDDNRVGEVTLLENIQEEEEAVPEGETEEDKKKREDAELADKMSSICQQTLERIQPVMKQITEYIEKADRTPKDELDEEELVNNVKPLIEEGSRILQECNGSLRGLDPDGRIAQQAKGRAQTRDASPQEYRLADLLKELTSNVVTTIDNAKKKLQDMPHAKKKLNPLWSLLTEPLFQIIAAVGLLLSGVLGLVGRLLNALGLGGLVNGLLGGLGIDKLLGGLGLGSVTDMLGGGKKDKKKGGGMSNIPLVGGLLGGGK